MNGQTFIIHPRIVILKTILPGRCTNLAPLPSTEQEVLDFGKRFVPLSYHTDTEAGEEEHLRRRDRQRLAHRRADDAVVH